MRYNINSIFKMEKFLETNRGLFPKLEQDCYQEDDFREYSESETDETSEEEGGEEELLIQKTQKQNTVNKTAKVPKIKQDQEDQERELSKKNKIKDGKQ